jgi:2-polyprenyl-3-methyl-5-hydroxy-6-metoxy-1,4-benzoquinol methylase
VLDIGCGDGQISRLAASLGADVVGVDPTRNQITVARERGGGPVYLRTGAAALPFAEASFDTAVACLVYEHIRDVDDAIARWHGCSRPAGSSRSS